VAARHRHIVREKSLAYSQDTRTGSNNQTLGQATVSHPALTDCFIAYLQIPDRSPVIDEHRDSRQEHRNPPNKNEDPAFPTSVCLAIKKTTVEVQMGLLIRHEFGQPPFHRYFRQTVGQDVVVADADDFRREQHEYLEPYADESSRKNEQPRRPVLLDQFATEFTYTEREDIGMPVLFANKERHRLRVISIDSRKLAGTCLFDYRTAARFAKLEDSKRPGQGSRQVYGCRVAFRCRQRPRAAALEKLAPFIPGRAVTLHPLAPHP